MPAVLLAKLALDQSLHGQGPDTQPLADSLTGCLRAVESGPGARMVVVDEIDEVALGFYARHGFKPMPEHPLRMYKRVSQIVADLG